MLERMWGKESTPALLAGMQTCTSALEISMVISQKIMKQSILRPYNTSFGCIPKGFSIIPQGHVINYILSSIICNSQKLEIT